MQQFEVPTTTPEQELERRKQLEAEVTNSLPFHKELGEVVVTLKGIYKHYHIAGRTDTVRALEEINLNDEAEFYGIRRGEFVMIRGPSGGGKWILFVFFGWRTFSILNDHDLEWVTIV